MLTDASFFNVVHKTVKLEKDQSGRERRKRDRRPFSTVQRIAPRLTDEIPARTSFFPVRCHDLHEDGFSFLLPRRPTYNALVVVLGRKPQDIYLAAEVRHCSNVLLYPDNRVERITDQSNPVDLNSDRTGAVLMVQVGCRFLERLEPPATV